MPKKSKSINVLMKDLKLGKDKDKKLSAEEKKERMRERKRKAALLNSQNITNDLFKTVYAPSTNLRLSKKLHGKMIRQEHDKKRVPRQPRAGHKKKNARGRVKKKKENQVQTILKARKSFVSKRDIFK